MISAKELSQWLATLDSAAQVAIDDGGLTLCQVTAETQPHDETHGGPCIEIGGIPEDDEERAERIAPAPASPKHAAQRRRLTVEQNVIFTFDDLPADVTEETAADWFCSQENPERDADAYEVSERECTITEGTE
jgi:hypothetical protein